MAMPRTLTQIPPVAGFSAKKSSIFTLASPHPPCLRAGLGASVLGSKGVKWKP